MINNLQIVVLDCPVKYLNDPFVRDLFGKIAQLKVNGFNTVESKYFAFDKTDFVSIHFIVGQYFENEGFLPLIGFKGISVDRCKEWKISFPGMDILKSVTSEIRLYLESYILLESERSNLGYVASLALSPNIGDRKLRKELIQILELAAIKFNTDFDIERSFCIGRVKNSAYKLMCKIGYNPICRNGTPLPPVVFPQYMGDEFFILTFEDATEEAKRLLLKYDELWKNRITISVDESSQFHRDTFGLHHGYKKAF